MGKKFIIKDADFSANAVAIELSPIDVTSLMSFVPNWDGVQDIYKSDRCSISPRFDISPYILQGYTKIRVTVVTSTSDPAGVFPFIAQKSTGEVSGGDYEIISAPAGYLAPGVYEKNLSDFSAANKYFGVNINTNNVGVYSNLSDYMTVEFIS
jgi:hypothetical protein